MTANRESEIGREEFLGLPTERIREIVQEKKKPRVGIFVADGNRRLVMCRTRLAPDTEAFYEEYARFFVGALKESLDIFFEHGLGTLFFPLFGPSMLLRKNNFQYITVPAVYRALFQDDEWVRYYREKGIRVKAYGDLAHLEKIDVLGQEFQKGIKRTVEETAAHGKHTLFFGFMSENTPGMEMPQMVIDFYKANGRVPGAQEMVELYYGEVVPPADFLIFSDKLSLRALPPWLSFQGTQVYYLPVPGFLGFNEVTFRKILYDRLYLRERESVPEYRPADLKEIETLNLFYRQHRDTVIGIRKNIGGFKEMDL